MNYKLAFPEDIVVLCPLCKNRPWLNDTAHDCARQPDYVFQCEGDNCPLVGWPTESAGYGTHTIAQAAKYWNESVNNLITAIKGLE